MLLGCLALLAEIEVFTNTALVPHTNQRVALAAITGNSIMSRLLFLLFSFLRLLRRRRRLAKLISHHLGYFWEHLLHALLKELFPFGMVLLPELGVTPLAFHLVVWFFEPSRLSGGVDEDNALLFDILSESIEVLFAGDVDEVLVFIKVSAPKEFRQVLQSIVGDFEDNLQTQLVKGAFKSPALLLKVDF